MTEEEKKFIAEYEANLKPMTVEELVARALASEEDIKNGNFKSIESIMEEDWDNLPLYPKSGDSPKEAT